MKKVLMLMVITVFAGITLSCIDLHVQTDSFRVKTRGRIYVYGEPIAFSVPNQNIWIKLKTTTPSGTINTSGSTTEFDPNAYVSTDASGVFDAVDAVMPANWSARIAPEQDRCAAPEANPYSFKVSSGSTYDINCQWFVSINFIVQPSAIAIGGGYHPPNFTSAKSLTGILVKSINGTPYFRRFSDSQLRVYFYKQIDGEEYELEGIKSVTSVSPDGIDIVIPLPDYTYNRGIIHYRILIKEITDYSDVYVGHSELDVSYGINRW